MARKMKRVKAWSFSAYSLYDQCPFKYKCQKLDKLPEPPIPALQNGIKVHGLAEDYLKGQLKRLPPELVKFKDDFNKIKARTKKRSLLTLVEDQWAFTKDWDQCGWKDWAICWLRVKMDCAYEIVRDNKHIMVIRDWKTGKFRDSEAVKYMEQLSLYALAGMVIYPHIDEVWPELDYLDLGFVYDGPLDEDPVIFTQADVPGLKKEWVKRVRPMFADRKFAPKPNRFCSWCHFRKSNGGPCKF